MRKNPKRLGGGRNCLKFARMNWTTRCAAVIPCLNEAGNIAEVVGGARRFVSTVFVVDDGSKDATGALAIRAGAEVLRHAVPHGKGAALQAGWELARQRGFGWALTMDGDGQHSANDVTKFFEAAERSGAELVVGNRMENPKGMPRVRRLVNRFMSKRISALAGISLPDSQCGFRLMNLETWATLAVGARHFEIESDVLLAFARQGRRIEFVPIEVIYRSERSKIHPVRDTVRWVQWWQRARNSARKHRTMNIEHRTSKGDIEAEHSTLKIQHSVSNEFPD
jgi:glycosyltransferase involved in cell wall biosynthesis